MLSTFWPRYIVQRNRNDVAHYRQTVRAILCAVPRKILHELFLNEHCALSYAVGMNMRGRPQGDQCVCVRRVLLVRAGFANFVTGRAFEF